MPGNARARRRSHDLVLRRALDVGRLVVGAVRVEKRGARDGEGDGAHRDGGVVAAPGRRHVAVVADAVVGVGPIVGATVAVVGVAVVGVRARAGRELSWRRRARRRPFPPPPCGRRSGRRRRRPPRPFRRDRGRRSLRLRRSGRSGSCPRLRIPSRRPSARPCLPSSRSGRSGSSPGCRAPPTPPARSPSRRSSASSCWRRCCSGRCGPPVTSSPDLLTLRVPVAVSPLRVPSPWSCARTCCPTSCGWCCRCCARWTSCRRCRRHCGWRCPPSPRLPPRHPRPAPR